jgi:hypothetical protein
MGFRPPTNAQAIEVIIRHRPGLTELEIAEAIFGKKAYQQRVNADCRWLTAQGYITKAGRPARYIPARPGPPAKKSKL